MYVCGFCVCVCGIVFPMGSKYLRFYIFYTQKRECQVNEVTEVSATQAIYAHYISQAAQQSS